MSSADNISTLISEARQGQEEVRGSLLESYRHYLTLLARSQLSRTLQVRASPSDVVQETFLEAHRDFEKFRGGTAAELLAWMRRILLHNIARVVEHHRGTRKRDVRREDSLRRHVADLERSSAQLDMALVSACSTPSGHVQRREQAVLLANQLAQLSPSYREVIILRNLEDCSFDEIARKMGRSTGAVRMLWLRAIDRLRDQLQREKLI
jgi:RNA polymerase sigma-70 factor (ECF subfamily)